MGLTGALATQLAQMLLVLVAAPAVTGLTRKSKARLQRRAGPPILQSYRDLRRLLAKEAILADGTSWLFRAAPYLIFAATWVAAALVPTFQTGLLFSWSGDLIAIVALLGLARFLQAAAALDTGTSFGGMGASRELMIAALAEPAMIMIVFTVALVADSTQLSTIANFMVQAAGLRVSLAMALVALVIVALAENGRIPFDNPATHLELTMVHEAMVLEYSGRHLALIELAGSLRLLLYLSLIACIFVPYGLATGNALWAAMGAGLLSLRAENRRLLRRPGHAGNLHRQDAGLPHAKPARHRPHARPARHLAALRQRGDVMASLPLDAAHMLAGLLVLLSFMMLYQDRLLPLISTLALQSAALAASVAWQAHIQNTPALYITALIAVGFKCVGVTVALRRMVLRMGLHRQIEAVIGAGKLMLAGIALVALSLDLMLRVTAGAGALVREDIALALSVVLLGLLMMVTRRNAVSQVIGFMSLETAWSSPAPGPAACR